MVSCAKNYFTTINKLVENLTYLVNVLCRRDALPVVLAMAEVGHQHLQQLRLLVWKFFYALQIVMIKLDFSFLHIFLESLSLKIFISHPIKCIPDAESPPEKWGTRRSPCRPTWT